MRARARFGPVRQRAQRGVALLEAMIAVILLAIGLMGTLVMQSRSVTALSEAALRAEAVVAATQLLGVMNADRDKLTDFRVASGAAPGARLAAWHADVLKRIPGATISVGVDTTDATKRTRVDIAINWQRTSDSQANVHRITSYLSEYDETLEQKTEYVR